jgi:predicted nucleic acid-binding protein
VSEAAETTAAGRILLDSGPLGRLTNPNANTPINAEINRWLWARLAAGATILVPEIVDYEIRRELLRLDRRRSLARLELLSAQLSYLPLDTSTMRRAAEMWAEVRRQGQPTADPRALDVDVILAAQAERAQAVVATENAGHLSRFVTARHWREIR